MLSKRLARALFLQGPGANYRKLSAEEKQEAKKNFLTELGKFTHKMPKIRNFANFFKDFIPQIKIGKVKQIPYEYTIHDDKYIDNYQWMTEEINCQEVTSYIAKETSLTDAVLNSQLNLGMDIFDEIKRRTPVPRSQVVEKAGCNL